MDEAEIRRLTNRAIEALRDEKYTRAVAIADQLAADVPDDPTVRAIRAQALLAGDTADEALAEARRAVELSPASEHAHRLLGLAAWRAERLTLAQQSLERAVELSSRRPDVLAEYAWFMASERGPRLAEEAAREAVDTNETLSTAWAALGLAQYRLRHRREAEESLRRALQLDPDDIYAQSAMAVLLQEMRQDDKAEALADLLQDNPGAEEFVAAVHDEAKNRQLAGILVERDLMPESPSDAWPRHAPLLLVIVVSALAVLYMFFRPGGVGLLMIGIIFPLLLLWVLRRLAR